MQVEYSILNFIFKHSNTYCLYYFPDNSEKDFFVIDNDKILMFSKIESVISYTKEHNMKLYDPDVDTLYDINQMESLCLHLDDKLNCSEVINFWNITDALCNSLNIVFIGNNKKYNYVYNELFGGCNTAINACEYQPRWLKKDLNNIQDVLKICVSIFKKYVL